MYFIFLACPEGRAIIPSTANAQPHALRAFHSIPHAKVTGIGNRTSMAN